MKKVASAYIMTTGCQCLKTQFETINKSLQKTLKDFGLEIATESNLKIVNYLGVALNLKDGSFRPCDKRPCVLNNITLPDDIIQYINKEFNHSPNLIKHLPASIEKQIKKIFEESAIYYKIH